MQVREQSIYVVSSMPRSMIVHSQRFLQKANFVVHYRDHRISPKNKLNMDGINLS